MKTAKGTFIKKNPTLKRLLASKGFDIDSIWEQISKDKGSVVGLPDHILSAEEKEVFLTPNTYFAENKKRLRRTHWP